MQTIVTVIKTAAWSCWVFFFLLVTLAAAATQRGVGQQMLAETNLARTAPQRYAGYLRELRRQYRGKNYQMPGTTDLVITSEGVTALDEAIRYLEHQTPLAALSWSKGLSEAAADLVSDEGASGEVGHEGSRSGGPRQRMRGTVSGRAGSPKTSATARTRRGS